MAASKSHLIRKPAKPCVAASANSGTRRNGRSEERIARMPVSPAARPRPRWPADPTVATDNHGFTGMIGGVQAGYNLRPQFGLPARRRRRFFVPQLLPSNSMCFVGCDLAITYPATWDYVASLRGGSATPAAPAGLCDRRLCVVRRTLSRRRRPGATSRKVLNTRPGWIAGGGVEYGFAPHWSARLEYLYSKLRRRQRHLPSGAQYSSSMPTFQCDRIGLNRKIDWPGMPTYNPKSDVTESVPAGWEIHGQPICRGRAIPCSTLSTPERTACSRRRISRRPGATASTSMRGYGMAARSISIPSCCRVSASTTHGCRGLPQRRAQKSGFPYPHFNASRLFVRHTFGFGGEQEELASGQFQLAGKADVSRLTLQVGKLSVVDVFDGNSYAHDPRKDFMNWSIWASGAFDYAADKLGLGYGATAELNQKQWALRAGYFLMDAQSNSNNFDMNIGRRGEYVAELETRFRCSASPASSHTRLVNSANSGSYRETLDNPALNLDIARPAAAGSNRLRVNLEQAITDDIGVFGRWSWNDGRNEIMAFTDIDRSLSGGLSVKGAKWGRPDDVVAIAGAINGLSQDYRDFIAAGGLGPLIGDGQLNYRKERVLETYYAYALNKAPTFTADYQLIVNPAYNADRGPVSVFSGRLHGEF